MLPEAKPIDPGANPRLLFGKQVDPDRNLRLPGWKHGDPAWNLRLLLGNLRLPERNHPLRTRI
jgi:hypothetical protein